MRFRMKSHFLSDKKSGSCTHNCSSQRAISFTLHPARDILLIGYFSYWIFVDNSRENLLTARVRYHGDIGCSMAQYAPEYPNVREFPMYKDTCNDCIVPEIRLRHTKFNVLF